MNPRLSILSWAVIAATAVELASLAALHVLSPEFDPSWRMVSEYANGSYGPVLSVMFLAWGAASFALLGLLWPYASTLPFRIGLVFLFLSGIGEAAAAFFDITHPLHSLAAALGIPGFPVAALLIGLSLAKRAPSSRRLLLWMSQLPWISLLAMAAAFAVLMATYSQSGATIDPNAKDVQLPAGVIALVGWANRALIVVYGAWAVAAAWQTRRLSPPRS